MIKAAEGKKHPRKTPVATFVGYRRFFNDFVNQYYLLAYRNDDSAFPIRVYTKASAVNLWHL